jgi:hypothetical protein
MEELSPSFDMNMHLKGKLSHLRSFDEARRSVMMMLATAIPVPLRVIIASLDQDEEADGLRLIGRVVSVCVGGVGATWIARRWVVETSMLNRIDGPLSFVAVVADRSVTRMVQRSNDCSTYTDVCACLTINTA